MKRHASSLLLTYLGGTAAFSLMAGIIPATVVSATVVPIDEPPCYIRTQDGRIVNLQSLCSRTLPQPTQASPTTNQPTQRTLSPQTAPTPVNNALGQREPSRSHANGNPDSDDGRY